MKKSTKNKPRLLKFVFVILFVAGLFFAGLFYIRFSFNNGFSKLACDFKGYKWFDYQEILNTDISKFDAHMRRFAEKLFVSDLVKI